MQKAQQTYPVSSEAAVPLSEEARDTNEHEAPAVAGLVLVSTPIGNLGDLTPRALETLRTADLVLCEDTRVTAKLLAAQSLRVRMQPLHDHNERDRADGLVARLLRGERMALVSDAGTPLLSDPGFRLVRAAIAAGVTVSAAPGANAAITALTLSGLPPHPFLFAGFPPPRAAARRTAFATLRACERAGLGATVIWHEAPHRLAEMLADLAQVFGTDRACAVTRELTKRFEEVRRDSLGALATFYGAFPPRGEITVVMGPAPVEEPAAQDLDAQLKELLQTHSVKDAAALAATAAGLPRRHVYARALALSATSDS